VAGGGWQLVVGNATGVSDHARFFVDLKRSALRPADVSVT
jgi:hypothetical protein